MNAEINKVVIVGGGTAGWITAGVLAVDHNANSPEGLTVVLIESPSIAPIGVGEGTWPTMRSTLKKLKISESDFIRECDASFKQASKFVNWASSEEGEYYYHPFTLPQDYARQNPAIAWLLSDKKSFADAVCYQSALCDQNLAPKQIETPEYAYVANYGYHLDSVKFSAFLKKHCIEKLGVKYICDDVVQINADAENAHIKSVSTSSHGLVDGDIFVDCTGFNSILIGKHFSIPFHDKKNILFVDNALAVQIPYESDDAPIASSTLSTGQKAGWIWDIGLPTRRGIGYVYSSAHTTELKAEEEIQRYVASSLKDKVNELSIRKIPINSGYTEKFWHKNCVAIGLSAGFLEPLEASALVLVELSAQMLSEELPATRAEMLITEKRFNEKFHFRWQRIIDFLKLHYFLSRRTDSDFWNDNRESNTVPDSLLELLEVWKNRAPWHCDFFHANEVFPSASYQYVLYGMGFKTHLRSSLDKSKVMQDSRSVFDETKKLIDKCSSGLPTNRELINKIKLHGLQKI